MSSLLNFDLISSSLSLNSFNTAFPFSLTSISLIYSTCLCTYSSCSSSLLLSLAWLAFIYVSWWCSSKLATCVCFCSSSYLVLLLSSEWGYCCGTLSSSLTSSLAAVESVLGVVLAVSSSWVEVILSVRESPKASTIFFFPFLGGIYDRFWPI